MAKAGAAKNRWATPTPVSDLDIAFPAGVSKLMPAMSEIPDKFKRDLSPWCRWQAEWFYRGLKSIPQARNGVDQQAAIRHLKCIQGSFEPKHEHKAAAVAYLASQWFKEVTP